MIAKIIEFSVRNRWMVILVWLGIAIWGLYAVVHTPVDAIPDLSENQVIVFTDWMGRSPQDIEEQITYPLSVQLQGLAGVKAVRSSSEFNFSMINIIFDEGTDFYFARNRVLERLAVAQSQLPQGVVPYMAPDATALGQIFWYTVEGEGKSLDELRAIQDYTVRYQLASVPGVAEVASVGGMVREYQVDVDPNKLRSYDLPLGAVYSAIQRSNLSVGGKTVVANNSEYIVRGVGWLKGIDDLGSVIVDSRQGTPIRVKNVASVQLGPEYRRSALEKNGREAVGGVVMMRYGENPLAVTDRVKEAIRQLQSGLPEGVRVVPFYDRTRLIESAIHTVTGTLREEMIIAAVAILLILAHFRSALVVCITLPMAVLVAFLLMFYLKIPSNIMSLCGIAISIGILVDAAVVMVENATHDLKNHFGNEKVSGDTTEIIVHACRLVGRPIFFSVVIMLLSFLPVFAFGGQEGKLSHPLAYTKSFAMVGVALLAITFVPALIPLFIRGRLRREDENWIVRSFINVYKPTLSWAMGRPAAVWWMTSIILALGVGFTGSQLAQSVMVALGVVFILLGTTLSGGPAAKPGAFGLANRGFARLLALVTFLGVAYLADTHFHKLGGEFMPSLNEGSIMDMPTTAPRIAMNEAIDDVSLRDRIMRGFPEVESVVGKVGRADTATDPSPIDMIETIVMLHPADWWPRRTIRFDDLLDQSGVVARALQDQHLLAAGKVSGDGWKDAVRAISDRGFAKYHSGLTEASDMLNTAAMASSQTFDRAMRDLARRRQLEYEPTVTQKLSEFAVNFLMDHVGKIPGALLHQPTDADRQALVTAANPHVKLIGEVPRQEEVDKLLESLRKVMVDRGVAANRDDLLLDPPNRLRDSMAFVGQAIGVPTKSPAPRLMAQMEQQRNQLWVERTKTLNWELFDYGVKLVNDLLVDNVLRSSKGTIYEAKPNTEVVKTQAPKVKNDLEAALHKDLFLWPKSKDDVLKEMDSELQMPGWGNAWTQPIINRVNMLATGVRTQIGVKIFGPTGKPLDQAIGDVQKISEEVAAKLRTVRGAVDVVADQAVGKRYVEIRVDPAKAEHYGVNMAELAEAIETAVGGSKVTTTIEGRQRFPVRLRYARDYWQDVDAIGDVLITARTTPPQLQSMDGGGGSEPAGMSERASASPSSSVGGEMGSSSGGMGGAGGGSSSSTPQPKASASKSRIPSADLASTVTQIPLRMVADIRVTEGPSMVKSENGRLRNYVTLNVRDRDVISFVDEARQAIKPIEAKLAGTGMSIEWTGEFENQVRARQTMAVIFPMVVVLILFLLFVTFHDFIDTLLVSLAVLGALAGSIMFQAAFGFNFSVIVSIGYVAAFGMATETGVIMLVYLREAIDRHGGLEKIGSLDELRRIVTEGAVHRLRPKLLTEGVAIVGLVPMLWATGTGAEIMRPMAAPVLGGLLISDEVIDIMIPVLFYWIRRRRWQKLHPEAAEAEQPEITTGQPAPQLAPAPVQ